MSKRPLNTSILGITIPEKIRRNPISDTGYPTPWFVAEINGSRQDLRIVDANKRIAAIKRKLCWVCGQPLGVNMVFVLGPMCVINRTTAEPPCHRDCADYSARACPFLTKPRMRRNEVDMPKGHAMSGTGIMRNPGAVALYFTKSYKLMRVDNGVLFRVGDPEQVLWFAEGRTATRAEIDESIRTGLPILEAEARKDGPEALADLARYVARAQPLLPSV